VTYDGEHYSLDGVRTLRSWQDHVPLLVGVNGKRALAHAARHADIIGLTMLGRTFEDGQRHEVRWQQERLDATVSYISEQAGERWEQVELNVLVQAVVVTDDRQEAAQKVVSRVSGLSVDDALSTPFLAIGTHDEIADHLLACRNRWGISYFSVRDIDGFAPVIQRLQDI
jgi:alkanesulfonate monooxygenase SsuD/methylene tetrahydromethanopterin reductase-like flavin-dependent oxidoreductase (luciferase family)